ncbi:hypothetical protein J6590_019909 [Homalodisca vitripennis]|nr:hypothetical protein J6590_019909 [Homalodisca vitripennis]
MRHLENTRSSSRSAEGQMNSDRDKREGRWKLYAVSYKGLAALLWTNPPPFHTPPNPLPPHPLATI